jgi:type VI secretion system protein ImpK
VQAEIAQLVHSVLNYAVELKARLDRGEEPDFDAQQAELKDRLLSDYEARRWPEYGGEPPRERGTLAARSAADARPDNSGQFLGIRYALVCWLDELFTCHSPWAAAWNEHKLEVDLYGSNDRAWRFWEQAKLAQSRPGNDALEAFYLCVALGFRGELREQPEGLQVWTNHAKTRLGKVQEPAWPLAAAIEPPTRVPPLRGRERLRRMVLCGWLTLLALIPLAAYCLVSRLGNWGFLVIGH